MNRSSEAGFTLLEVLVAVALVSIVVITIIESINYHLDVAHENESRTIAALLAHDMLVQSKESPGESKGVFEPPYEAYSYSVSLSNSPITGISEMSVTVTRENVSSTMSSLVPAMDIGQ